MIALGLLTASAGCHAAWNLLLKRGGLGGPGFVWVCGVLMLPVSTVLLVRGQLTTVWWAALVSMALHTAYAVTLQKAYALGDFTAIYPISRGAAPALVSIVMLPGPRVFVGAGLTFAGVLMLDRPHSRQTARSVGLGLVVAGFTAAYTVWDGYAVTTLHVDLPSYLAVANLAQVVVLTAVVRDHRHALTQWRQALPVAVLMPVSYALVLLALSFADVGTVAVGRTLNVVLGAVLGAIVLRERPAVVGPALIVAGVLLVSL